MMAIADGGRRGGGVQKRPNLADVNSPPFRVNQWRVCEGVKLSWQRTAGGHNYY